MDNEQEKMDRKEKVRELLREAGYPEEELKEPEFSKTYDNVQRLLNGNGEEPDRIGRFCRFIFPYLPYVISRVFPRLSLKDFLKICPYGLFRPMSPNPEVLRMINDCVDQATNGPSGKQMFDDYIGEGSK